MALNEVHISSLVVHVPPEFLAETKATIETLDGAEVYGDSEEGKIIVVLETENQGYVTDTIDVINNLPNVLNTALVFHQIESDLETFDQEIVSTEVKA
jgi:nitrate reductase NapD